MNSKKVVFTSHAKQRAFERLNIEHDRFSLLFENELKNIFKKSRMLDITTDGKHQYETVWDGKKITFICNESNSQIIVNTVIVK